MRRSLLCFLLLTLVCDSSDGQDTLRVLVHESPIDFDQAYEDSLFAEDFQTAFNQIFEAADFDGDGDMDFYTDAYVSRSASVSVEYFSLFMNESGSDPRFVLDASRNFRIEGQQDPSAVGDLNGDDLADFVVGSTSWHRGGQADTTKPDFYGESDYSAVHVLLSREGDYQILEVPGTELYRTGTSGILPISSDDTDEVVITTDPHGESYEFKVFEIEDGSVLAWKGHSSSLPEFDGQFVEAAEVLSMDVDGDEDRDLVMVYSQRSDGRTWITWMPTTDGEVDFAAEVLLGQLDVSPGFVIAANEEAVRAADFDADGLHEVIIWWIDDSGDGSADEYLSVHEVSSSGLQDVTSERFPTGRNWDRDNHLGTGIQLADLNGDGLTDIVPEQGWGWGSENPSIFMNDGSGTMVETILDLTGIRSKGAFPKPIDFDGDGFFEILFAPVVSDVSMSEIQLAQIVFPEMAPSDLALGLSDKDTLTYAGDFAAGSLRLPIQVANPRGAEIEFQLSGHDEASFHIHNQSLVNSEQLRPGSYTLEIEARDSGVTGLSVSRAFQIEIGASVEVSKAIPDEEFYLSGVLDWGVSIAQTLDPIGVSGEAFSVSAWIYANTSFAFPGMYFGGQGVLFGLQDPGDSQADIAVLGQVNGAGGEFAVFLDDYDLRVGDLATDTWHHIALTGENGEVALWVNGVVRGVRAIRGEDGGSWALLLGNDGALEEGGWFEGRQGMPGATYSSVAASNRAWTESEITSQVGGVMPQSDSAIGFWPLNEGSGKFGYSAFGNAPPILRGVWESFDGQPSSSPLVWRSAGALRGEYWDVEYSSTSVEAPPFREPGLDTPTAGDLDGDGDIDLLYHGANNANCADPASSEGFLVLTNLGDRFDASWHSYGGLQVFNAGAGGPLLFDAGGSSLPDLVIAEHGADISPCNNFTRTGVHVLQNSSSKDAPAFEAAADRGTTDPNYHHWASSGDLDLDGRVDLLARGGPTWLYRNTNSGLESIGDAWLPAEFSHIGEGSFYNGWTIEPIDVDGDGRVEILLGSADGPGSPDRILQWSSDSLRYVDRPQMVRWTDFGEHRPQVEAFDIDADGDLDLISYAAQGLTPMRLRVFENVDGEYLQDRPDWDIILEDGHISRWEIGDVNGDGYFDLLPESIQWNGGTRMWLFQPERGWFDAGVHYPASMRTTFQVIESDRDGRATQLHTVFDWCYPQTADSNCLFRTVKLRPTEAFKALWSETKVPVPQVPTVSVLLAEDGSLRIEVDQPSLTTCHEVEAATDQAFSDVVYRLDCYAPDSLTTPVTFSTGLFVRVRSHLAARISPWSATVAVGPASLERPVAGIDAYDMLEDATLAADAGAGVLANDSSPSAYALQTVLVDSTIYGALSLALDGSFTYLPDPDFFGEDGFTYFATDGYDSTAVAQVSLTVAPVNDPPVPAAVAEPVPGATLTVGGDPTDSIDVAWPPAVDVDGDPLSYVYHLATTAAFADTVWVERTAQTSVSIGVGALAARLTALGVDEGGSRTFHHRVSASDADTTAAGPSAELTLVRGAVTRTDDAGELPTELTLLPAYPNPFNPQTTVGFGLPEAAEVRFELFDILGRRVRTMSTGRKVAGWHRMTLDASGLATGSYLMRLEVGERTLTRTVVLFR